jgi:superfamily II DNA helicase RecQ
LLSKRAEKVGDQGPRRELAAFDEMVDYCVKLGCRRLRLLKHFGEKIDPPKMDICGKTCDFCSNPAKVEKAMETARAANDFSFRTALVPFGATKTYNPTDEDGEDYEDMDLDAWNKNGLAIKGGKDMESDDFDGEDIAKKLTENFLKASSILSKYEAVEDKSSLGFVTFKAKVNSFAKMQDDRIRIPQHLIPVKRASAQNQKVNTRTAEKTSADFEAEANRLKTELANVKAEREALIEGATEFKRELPPPPPPLSFAPKRRKK